MRGVLTIGFVASALLSCTPGGGIAEDPEGRFRFTLGEDVRPDVEGRKVRWRTSELTVAAQRVPRIRAVRPVTLEDVGRALSQRYALGEVEGRLRSRPCELAGTPARCLDGTIVDGDLHAKRIGWVVVEEDDLLLVELVVPEPGADALDDARERFEQSFEWTAAEDG